MLYKKILEKIKLNKTAAENGEILGIPYPYPRLNEHLTCLDKGQSIAVVSQTGSGKSKWSRYTFLYHPYKFAKENNYPLRIIYVSMEDNKEKVYYSIIGHYLKDVHGITISMKELLSKDKNRILPDFVLEKLEEAVDFFGEFEETVTMIDGMTEPEELYETCKEIALSLGTVTKYHETIGGKEVKQYSYESDTHVIAIFDNLSNISSEDMGNENIPKLKFAKEYVREKLCNFFRWTCLTVLQLDGESERQQYSKDGTSLMAKLEPSLAGIGDSKRAGRTFHLIFSLFSPARYEFISYPQPNKHNPDNYYRVDILGDKFRALRIIKANDSMPGLRVGLLFDALGEIFTELPQPTSPEMDIIYKSLSNKSLTGKNFEIPKEKNTFVKRPIAEMDDELPF